MTPLHQVLHLQAQQLANSQNHAISAYEIVDGCVVAVVLALVAAPQLLQLATSRHHASSSKPAAGCEHPPLSLPSNSWAVLTNTAKSAPFRIRLALQMWCLGTPGRVEAGAGAGQRLHIPSRSRRPVRSIAGNVIMRIRVMRRAPKLSTRQRRRRQVQAPQCYAPSPPPRMMTPVFRGAAFIA